MVHKYAKKVFDNSTLIDRTKFRHDFKFDIDIKDPSDGWAYFGSVNSIKEAEDRAKDFNDARIVEATTGKIVKQITGYQEKGL
jgi:hypothetical protein